LIKLDNIHGVGRMEMERRKREKKEKSKREVIPLASDLKKTNAVAPSRYHRILPIPFS
jgi:hypothetical protein